MPNRSSSCRNSLSDPKLFYTIISRYLHWCKTLESIQEDFNTYEFYKMVADDRIVGALKIRMTENNVLWIGRLIVHPEFQNRGLGKALMRYMEQKSDSATGFELYTGSKSTRNIRFYESLGFSISGKCTEPGHSDIVMVKMIKTN
jgi:ribosomal protein S18 acetylase RimI-like enzyme